MFIGNFLRRLEFNLDRLHKKSIISSEDFYGIIFQILDLKEFSTIGISTKNHYIEIEDSDTECYFTMTNDTTNATYRITFGYEDKSQKSYYVRTNFKYKEFSIDSKRAFVNAFKKEISEMIEDREIYADGSVNSHEEFQIVEYIQSLIKKGYKNPKVRIENDNEEETNSFKIYYENDLIIEYREREDEFYYLGALQCSTTNLECVIAKNIW